jgi:hypothetical protein
LADPFSETKKAVTLKFGAAAYAARTDVAIPPNVTLDFSSGGKISVNQGKALTVRGGIDARLTQVFDGAGTVVIVSDGIIAIYPQWFGAAGNGNQDDTLAIQKSIDALAGGRGWVLFPRGTYLVTKTLNITRSGVRLSGAGQAIPIIKFNPTADAAAVSLRSGTPLTIAQNSIVGMKFDATGEQKHIKTAIQVVDAEELQISDVSISNWSDVKKQSVGLEIQGRQSMAIDRITVAADQPILLKVDPNTDVVAADHVVFRDIYAIADRSQPVWKIDDGVWLTNVTWTGYQAWVLGSYGIYWKDTKSKKSFL